MSFKRTIILCVALLAGAAGAQQTNNVTARSEQPAGAVIGRTEKDLARLGETKPNEIVKGNLTYSGVIVEALKSGNVLELINPVAPPAYGKSEDNVARDPITGRVSGLKFFSIRF